MDVHKRSVYITEMEDNGDVKEQYEIVYGESAWAEFINVVPETWKDHDLFRD